MVDTNVAARESRQRARAALVIAGAVGAGACALVLAVLATRAGDRQRGTDAAPRQGEPTPLATGVAPAGDLRDAAAPAAPARVEPALAPPPAPAQRPNSGRLIVAIARSGSAPLLPPSERWTLYLGRVPRPEGRGAPAPREIACEASPCIVEDLAFGDYRLRASAEGAASASIAIVLDAADAERSVQLALEPAGTIHGAVRDERGDAVEGLAVELRRAGDGALCAARTDAAGRYALGPLLPGPAELVFGDAQAPLAGPRAIEVAAGRLDLGDEPIGALLSIDVSVTDSLGNPVALARVWGAGSHGGWIEGTTDERGALVGSHLRAGRYRIHAEHAQHGRANDLVELGPAEPARAEIVLPR